MGRRRSALVGCAMVAVLDLISAHAFAEQPCPAPRVRPEEIEEIADRSISDDALLQGNIKHASEEALIRPVPKMTAIDYKRSLTKYALSAIDWRAVDALFFTIHDKKYPSTDPEVLNLSFDLYWCLAAKGDEVLLSNGDMDHYSRIASIDRESQTVVLIDRWPNFLSEFIGTRPEAFLGTSGKLAGSTLVRFTRADFTRLFSAAITLDTPKFGITLQRLLPGQVWTPELEIALGLSFLYAGRKNDSFAIFAAEPLWFGIREAMLAGNRELAEATVPAAFTAIKMAFLIRLARGELDLALTQQDRLDQIGTAPIQRLSAEDSLRIARVASGVDVQAARLFYDDAIGKDPADHRALLGKSLMMHGIIRQTWPIAKSEIDMAVNEMVKQTATVLRLIDESRRQMDRHRMDLAQRRGRYWEKGDSAVQEDDAEREELKMDRAEALRLRGAARLYLGDFAGAKADALELIELEPGRRDGYEIAGEALILLGQASLGGNYLERAAAIPVSSASSSWRIGPQKQAN